MTKLAVIVTTSDLDRLATMVAECIAEAASGAAVRMFFRDESIPLILSAAARERIGAVPVANGRDTVDDWAHFADALERLGGTGDVSLHACSSSLYVWGVSAADLAPALSGGRGLIAFLADDLDGADRVLSY